MLDNVSTMEALNAQHHHHHPVLKAQSPVSSCSVESRIGGGGHVLPVAFPQPAGLVIDRDKAGSDFSAAAESQQSDVLRSPASVLDSIPEMSWQSVPGLEAGQVQQLHFVATSGVQWKHPEAPLTLIFTLHYGGEVEADGNCLFTASQKAMGVEASASEVRERTVQRFLLDYESDEIDKDAADTMISHLYSPDLTTGWGVHVVQDVKLLAKKSEREEMDEAIEELVSVGMTRDRAAESVYKERCLCVNEGYSWVKYMSVSGQPTDEHDIITLQYTEEGLLSVDENRRGRAAAFGDDIAIESLATEYEREIFVVQAHGSDAMMEEACLFFLPHRPRRVKGKFRQPVFLLMKGTGWCGGGGDHYEPLIARLRPKEEVVGNAPFVL
ncbi:hypothetical protein CBR_g40425 [Chara braunii]|uniref:OTU domain-containing protein n=1 Tax=Chara braunii TaxID=69332 RepID=A0A388LTW1_CHABU|nr:hypothetical protein CBR_g40425 [Chara braunii]|eukprot:GBG85695.1 hypothetical protein CBR_g40425 [Chara braunii]